MATPAFANDIRRANVLGVGVNALSGPETLDIISSVVVSRGKGYICATGVHGVMEAQKDPVFRAILNNSLLTMPDGRPTVWVGRMQGFRGMTQLTGPNLMLHVCAMSARFTVATALPTARLSVAPGVPVTTISSSEIAERSIRKSTTASTPTETCAGRVAGA